MSCPYWKIGGCAILYWDDNQNRCDWVSEFEEHIRLDRPGMSRLRETFHRRRYTHINIRFPSPRDQGWQKNSCAGERFHLFTMTPKTTELHHYRNTCDDEATECVTVTNWRYISRSRFSGKTGALHNAYPTCAMSQSSMRLISAFRELRL